MEQNKKNGAPAPFPAQKYNDVIPGRNAVMEALRAGRAVDSVLVARGNRSGALGGIIAQCREAGIPVKEVDGKKLDAMCGVSAHQGVAAVTAAHEYAAIEDILSAARAKNEPPFLILCDELEDPHNLGAILRSAEAAGAHGVVIPKRRSAGLTFTVAKTACGAVEYVPVARVGSLAAAIDSLKAQGLWIYGADMDGAPWCETDFSGPVGLVIGAEGKGLGRLIREKCDFIVSLPMRGHIQSLNASVAAGILMYEVTRQRLGLKAK